MITFADAILLGCLNKNLKKKVSNDHLWWCRIINKRVTIGPVDG